MGDKELTLAELVKIREDLTATKAYIEEHGWTRLKERDLYGRVCVSGGMCASLRERGITFGAELPDGEGHITRERVALEFLADELLDGLWPVAYNDQPGRTEAEVLALLQQGIDLAGSRVGTLRASFAEVD